LLFFILVEQGAHELFRRPITGSIYGRQYDQYIQDILESFKQIGISLLVEDDRPNILVKSLFECAKLKVFFRLWYPITKDLPLSGNELEIISKLGNQEALIYSSD